MAKNHPRKKWSDLTTGQRIALIVAATLELTLAASAWRDLARRPAARVRGPKGLWGAIIAVNFVGPVAYFIAGRVR
ncbi:PLDc N-terminal domain-containing protein [Glaciihabitans sp. dw_435]|uniref:PLDc N-terminal domain-containing protein n=1 Tax=Glaciihabitans sp. dw_435 TaxID=2720081 RepID=UPI001BD64EF0|nr:PLDc N-terminal domain-containing protein [Glaciihabitans sp. dw_435]